MAKIQYNDLTEIELDEKNIKTMTHALGVEIEIKNKKRKKVEAYRNYYYGMTEQIDVLIGIGFMKEIRKDCYAVKKLGVLWLQLHFDKIITFRDFEDVYE